MPSREFCPISGDWGELRIPNLAQMSLINCKNVRVTASFAISELLRGEKEGGGGVRVKITPHPDLR